MKKIKVLLNEDSDIEVTAQLDRFLKESNYTDYLYVRSDEGNLTLYALEDENHIREVVFSAESEGDNVVVAIQGKMDKKHFARQLNKHTSKK